MTGPAEAAEIAVKAYAQQRFSKEHYIELAAFSDSIYERGQSLLQLTIQECVGIVYHIDR